MNTDDVTGDGSGILKEAVHLGRILVPTDFSQDSYRAIQYARALAGVFHSKVILLHVLVPVAAPDLVYGPLVWDEAKALESAKGELEKLRAKAHFPEEIDVICRVEMGHPFQVIADVGKESEADLILVATHGYTGFKHLVLGSVAERVIRHAPCPVLVVREKEHEFISIEEEGSSGSGGD